MILKTNIHPWSKCLNINIKKYLFKVSKCQCQSVKVAQCQNVNLRKYLVKVKCLSVNISNLVKVSKYQSVKALVSKCQSVNLRKYLVKVSKSQSV